MSWVDVLPSIIQGYVVLHSAHLVGSIPLTENGEV
uniref:Uncharacterized protein n=1 Tax=Anguilla anguilla TaxID=7936 RepID=A0A0E9XFX4_ANGAN